MYDVRSYFIHPGSNKNFLGKKVSWTEKVESALDYKPGAPDSCEHCPI